MVFSDFTALIDFERHAIQYAGTPSPNELGIAARVGTLPLLFSAPHACRHKRGGAWKQEDEYTGAIAEWLHRLTGAHALYLTHQIDPDPHDDGRHNPYKQLLASFMRQHEVRLVIDLHGTRGDREFGVALGSMNGVSCPHYEPKIIQIFEQHGFKRQGVRRLDTLAINHPLYTGGLRQPTITHFVHHEVGVAALQIELNAWVRIVQRLPHSTNAQQNNVPFFQCDHRRFQRVMEAFISLTQLFCSP